MQNFLFDRFIFPFQPKFTANHREKSENHLLYLKNRHLRKPGLFHYDNGTNRKGGNGLINQVTLVGRLTRDPELKFTPEGVAVTNIVLAVPRNYRNSSGQIDTDFVQCTLWRRIAENTVQYCRKGQMIGIVGRIQTRNYVNKEGQRVYVTEVIGDQVTFLSRSSAENHDNDDAGRAETTSRTGEAVS